MPLQVVTYLVPARYFLVILRGIILNTRPKKSAHAYQQVWTEKGSPLAAITAGTLSPRRPHPVRGRRPGPRAPRVDAT